MSVEYSRRRQSYGSVLRVYRFCVWFFHDVRGGSDRWIVRKKLFFDLKSIL
ncbi:hypothetical protein Hanom_Chr02g00128491 [Helianthus anomalus]